MNNIEKVINFFTYSSMDSYYDYVKASPKNKLNTSMYSELK